MINEKKAQAPCADDERLNMPHPVGLPQGLGAGARLQ